MLASAARALVRQIKSAVRVSVLAVAAFGVLEETALARSYLSCLAKKVVIVDAPKGTTSSSAEENFGFWIDEPTKIVTFADGKKLNVRRFDDHWISWQAIEGMIPRFRRAVCDQRQKSCGANELFCRRWAGRASGVLVL